MNDFANRQNPMFSVRISLSFAKIFRMSSNSLFSFSKSISSCDKIDIWSSLGPKRIFKTLFKICSSILIAFAILRFAEFKCINPECGFELSVEKIKKGIKKHV